MTKHLTKEQLDSITVAQVEHMRYLKAECMPVIESLKESDFAGTLVLYGLNGVKTKHLTLTAEAAIAVYKALVRNGGES